MRFNILGMIAAVALVAACETAPTKKDAASGSGLTEAYSSKTPSMVKGSQQDLVVNVGDRVYFDYDKYNLQADSRQVLEKQAAWLKENGAVKVVIEGHADERGTREYNLALGERRANSVKDYLVALGIADNRIDTISFGKERDVAKGSNEAAWAQNRRSVTVTQ